MQGGPKLLFISPAWPRRSGMGLSMRAWAVSEALGRRYAVTLVVPHPDGLPTPEELPPNVTAGTEPAKRGVADRIRRGVRAYWPVLYPSLYREPEDWPCTASLPRHLEAADFAVVHVFRQYMAPYAAPFFGKAPCRLDLDESEARTRLRVAHLYKRNGLARMARLLEAEARFFEREERIWLPRFEKLYVSSEPDRRYLVDRCLGAVATLLPNTIPVPAGPAPQGGNGPATLLFVGNLHYYPNEDAIRFFAGGILPLLRRARGEVRVQVAGNGPAKLRKDLSKHAGIEWLGFVTDLGPLYRNARVVIAPIRAGGGTRLKILEAFSHCCAVVATTAGAEGLDAVNGTHLIEAETPEEFATACLRLIDCADLRERIARAGSELAATRYSSSRLDAMI